MSAREVVLGRVRSAIVDVKEPDAAVDWVYGLPTPMSDVIERFVERVEDYRATVVRCGPDAVLDEVLRGLRETGAHRVVLPPGTDQVLQRGLEAAEGLSVTVDDGSLTGNDLDRTDSVVTTSVVGIAETGTIALDHGPGQGRRVLSLLPDRHICLVRARDIVSDVPEAVGRLAEGIRAGRSQTWISGPSATSDIELTRVEGVHGPRHLWVVVVED